MQDWRITIFQVRAHSASVLLSLFFSRWFTFLSLCAAQHFRQALGFAIHTGDLKAQSTSCDYLVVNAVKQANYAVAGNPEYKEAVIERVGE